MSAVSCLARDFYGFGFGLPPVIVANWKLPQWTASEISSRPPRGPALPESGVWLNCVVMNYKTRVLKRYPGAKLVKSTGEQDLYSVSDGDVVLCDSAKSPTDAWRRAALFLDRPYSDAHSRWKHNDGTS